MKKEKTPNKGRREFILRCSKLIPATAAGLFFIPLDPNRVIQALESGDYNPDGHNYAMGIDIHKCIGCGRCANACKVENNVSKEPHYFRTWIERYVINSEREATVDSPNGGIDGFPPLDDDIDMMRSFFVPKLCNHCTNAPCVQVCPVGATYTSRDGVVLVDSDYCVGCRYCIQACPYGARYLDPETHVADKCTFCYHRITQGLLPACVEACPTQARIFGEIGVQSSPLTRFLRFNEVTLLKASLNTQPKVYYAHADGEVR